MTEKTQPSGTIPEHYRQCCAVIEPRDILKKLPFQLGNACKYLLRAKYKGNEKQDLLKALDYLTWAKEAQEDLDPYKAQEFMYLIPYFNNDYLLLLFCKDITYVNYLDTICRVKYRINEIEDFEEGKESEKL